MFCNNTNNKLWAYKQKIVIFRDARQTDVSKGPGAIPGGLALSAGRFSNGEISEKRNVSPF